MVERAKRYIAELLLSQLLGKQKLSQKNFSSFFTFSKTILVVLPVKNYSLQSVDEVINYLTERGKKVTVFSTVEDFNKILTLHKCSLFEYSVDEINKVGLPNSYLQKRLKREKFDIVINLDSDVNIFSKAITKMSNSKYRVGFKGKQVDRLFNIQILKKSKEPNHLAVINTLNLF